MTSFSLRRCDSASGSSTADGRAAIAKHLEMLRSEPSAQEFAKETIDYAIAKTAYFEALRAAMPELVRNAIAEKKAPQLAPSLRPLQWLVRNSRKRLSKILRQVSSDCLAAPISSAPDWNSSTRKRSMKAFTRTGSTYGKR